MARRSRWLRTLVALVGSAGLLLAARVAPASAQSSANATHVVQPGETLSGIADGLGLDSAALARLNGLDDVNVLVVGQSLQLPGGPAAAAPPLPRTYTVADGDTLWRIAQQLSTTTGALVEANHLDDADHLVMGAQLVVPVGADGAAGPGVPASPPPAASGRAPSSSASAAAAPARRSLLVSYTVQPGETLNQIARQFDVSPGAVVQASGLDDPNHLSIGTVLKLPLPGHEHVVQTGETLRDIAGQERVDLGSLVDFNQLDHPELIHVGQVVLVPPAATLQAAAVGASAQPAAVASQPATVATRPAALPTPARAALPPAQLAAPAQPASSDAGGAAAASARPTPAAGPAPPTAAAPGPVAPADGLAAAGLKLVGAPYVWGGSSPSGFDCSGFVWFVARLAGRPTSRGLLGEYNASSAHPSRDDLKPGDLVFFQNTYAAGLSHNGIYVGNGQFVHAADEKVGVTVSSLGTAYWSGHWFGATRLSS